MARIATQLMLGKKLADLDLKPTAIPHFGVKEAVFPFNMFPEVDPVLGPEMRSTGEVLGMADSFGLAFYKAQEAAKQLLPTEGTVLITVAERDRPAVLRAARKFADLGFTILATEGTHKFLTEPGRRRRAHPQAPRGPAQHPGRHHQRRDPPGDQHAHRQAGARSTIPTSARPPSSTRCPTSPRSPPPRPPPRASPPSAAGGSTVRSLQEYHAALRQPAGKKRI